MPELYNLALLAGDALVYFAVLAGLFRLRHRLGIGAFFCALGVMHFIETYLASIFYIALPAGIVTSPGSSVLFTGKLMLLLLVYIREDAKVVRQPIYGLLIGNLLMVLLAALMRHHSLAQLAPGAAADFALIDQMGALMVWGTAVLFVDCILIVILYEHSRTWLKDRVFPRLALAGSVVLTFDQVAFYCGLHLLTGAPVSVLIGGWAAKMGAVAIYSVLVGCYLRFAERPIGRQRKETRVADVFEMLTYRERYEDLLARTGRDALTGAYDRGRLETAGRQTIAAAGEAARPVSLILIDIDNFKTFNDRLGHAVGDAVIRSIAKEVMAAVRASDTVFRFGGDEFVVICEDVTAEAAVALGERVRREIATNVESDGSRVTVSIGVATTAGDVVDYDSLFQLADRCLYQAKAAGRNCTIGGRTAAGDAPVRLVYSV
ncbi:MAG: GGDEF domain-containing protein [Xanthobacteraceae bacterium]|nr:GGDEF domain-containing protein [Xanthobacteraceae bacterium]